MHPNPVFRSAGQSRNLAFARERGFGTLVLGKDDGPLLAHVPFLLSENGTSADLHLVRSNPIAREPEGSAIISVSGPDGYISPDWYDVPDQVPTWNYVAVHMHGHLERLHDSTMRTLLDRQSDAYERRLLPKTPWTMDKMSTGARDRMMRMIVPFRFHISSVEGTWKLSHDKPLSARIGAADGVASTALGHETAALSRMMRRAGSTE